MFVVPFSLMVNQFLIMGQKIYQEIRRFATCLLVNNDLCGKLVSSSELSIIFDDNLKTYFSFIFNADFSLLSCEFCI